MYLLLPLTKGHLSNAAIIAWQTYGGLNREGLLYIVIHTTDRNMKKKTSLFQYTF